MTYRIALIACVFAMFAGRVAVADDYVILELGDKKIKKSEVETIWNNLFPGKNAPAFDTVDEPIKQNILRGVISEYLIYDEAVAAGLDKKPELVKQVEDAKRKLIVRHFLDSKGAELVSDKDIRREYDDYIKKHRDDEEVRARHILVKTEDEAKDIKKQIDDGEDFEALAKEHSKDPGSGAQGGDLGYFAEGKMVKPFSDAAFALKKGEISDPVESQFGWHIIKSEDRRKLKMPTFTEMKPQIEKQLEQDVLNDFVGKLVDKTNVKYFGPDGKTKELTKVPDSTEKD